MAVAFAEIGRKRFARVDAASDEHAGKALRDRPGHVVLQAVAAGRKELIRLRREGKIDDETLRELEHDLDLEELGAISAKA